MQMCIYFWVFKYINVLFQEPILALMQISPVSRPEVKKFRATELQNCSLSVFRDQLLFKF
jgi:hypothetical protein